MSVMTGLDRLVESLRSGARLPELPAAIDGALRGRRAGLVTNHSAVDRGLAAAPDALGSAGCRLAALFGPEHGVRGDAPDGEVVASGIDTRTGLPCHSLYGEHRKPTPEMLACLDLLLFDIQDVGARFYTFESTLSLSMEAAAGAGVPLVVLDRPNPIGGVAVEGPLLEPEQAPFVGLHALPIRHGRTLGELGLLFHHRFGVGARPHVVRIEGWSRADRWPATGRQWVPPSPNMPTPETALVYPGTCLLEGTSVSEGRGTARPFEFFGAPWLRAEGLADALNALELPGCRFRPHRFRPTASKHTGEACEGCQLHVTDPDAFLPVLTGVSILAVLRPADGFEWRSWQPATFSIDRLAGTSRVREGLDAGITPREMSAAWEPACRAFLAEARAWELYS